MKPYYEHAGITIYHGDCREILPLLSKVDLLCTDPPYGLGEANGKNQSRGKACPATDYGRAKWDDRPASPETISLAREKAIYQIIFGGNFFQLPPSPCWLVWDKDNSGDFADCELAWTNLKTAVRKIKWRWNGMLQEYMSDKETRFHPTQKPVPVIKWCVKQCPYWNTAITIIDPFMGSGTTLIAAKDLGRKAIGIEIEEKYCEIAAKRLSQEVLDFETCEPVAG